MGIRIDNAHLAALVVHCVDCKPDKIGAIKLLRNLTGLPLRESKEMVDAEFAVRDHTNMVLAKAESLFGKDPDSDMLSDSPFGH